MSNVVKCFEVLSMVLEVANKRFAPLWVLNEEKLNVLRQYCKAFDDILKECDGEAVDVEIDPDNMNVKITIECEDIIVEDNATMVFYELAERAISLTFKKSEHFEGVCATFVFPSLWERAGR